MKKILWIENNPDLIARFREILDTVEWELFIARSLRSADYKVEKEPGLSSIDTIIMDLNMDEYRFEAPYDDYRKELFEEREFDLTGLIWLRRLIESNPDYPPERIAVLSGFIDDGITEELKRFVPEVTVIEKLSFDVIEKLVDFCAKK